MTDKIVLTNNLQVNLVAPSTETSIVSMQKVHKQYHPEDLVSLAHSIQSSKEFVTQNTMSKLTVIAEQMKALEDQARLILEKAKEDHDLHNVPCNVQKIPGKIYYLWQKQSGEKFFSLIGPDEWSNTKNMHLGTYRFEYDRTFTEEKDFKAIKDKKRLVESYIGSSRAIEF
uniref:Uncharacterized protein n=1 Tax=Panagrolaimus superbus TaxID=310955 RepID=A0A914Y246_9BILA